MTPLMQVTKPFRPGPQHPVEGQASIDQQNLFRKGTMSDSAERKPLFGEELPNSLAWLINMRWLAGAGVLLGTLGATLISDLDIPFVPLYLLGLGLLAYNGLLWWVLRWLKSNPPRSDVTYQWFARTQIGLDWLATALLIHYTGGIESPAIFFFLFHITIASLLLPHDRGYLYVTLAPILVGGVAWLEYQNVWPHVHLMGPCHYTNTTYIAGVMAFFGVSVYVMAYLSMGISRRLRHREGELQTVYGAAQAVSSTLELPDVLNRLLEGVTRALGVRAASIRLLDETGTRLDMSAAYGLSQAYIDKGPVDVSRSRVYQEVLSGESVIIHDLRDPAHEQRTQYPTEMETEGIRSVLCVPLKAKERIIGVIRAYSRRPHRFTQDDAAFLSAIAVQGAVAIDNALAYQAVQELDKQKSQFIRMVTHELRSPVAVSQSLVRGIVKGYAGPLNDKQEELINRLDRRLDFLEMLVNDLLDLAAGKAGLVSDEWAHLDVNASLERVIGILEPQAREKNQELRYQPSDDSLLVDAVEEGLDRVFVNLVGNAVKYTPEGGQITVTSSRAQDRAQVTVRDTGIGIPEDAMSKLFEEFYRAPNAKAQESSGTGLGLSIAHDLVERFGGRITVESTEGEGTTFRVILPLVNPQ